MESQMGKVDLEGLDFNRECLQTDILSGVNPREWDLDSKRIIHEQLNPNGLYVYDKNKQVIDFSDEFKLLDFINSK
jgi:hypothetical protein